MATANGIVTCPICGANECEAYADTRIGYTDKYCGACDFHVRDEKDGALFGFGDIKIVVPKDHKGDNQPGELFVGDTKVGGEEQIALFMKFLVAVIPDKLLPDQYVPLLSVKECLTLLG